MSTSNYVFEFANFDDIKDKIRCFDLLLFRGGDPISSLICEMEKHVFKDGAFSHCGVVMTKDFVSFPNDNQVSKDQLLSWESTFSAIDLNMGPIDLESGHWRFGVQMRDLHDVIKEYISSSTTKVAWAKLINNPIDRLINETDAQYEVRMKSLKTTIQIFHDSVRNKDYDFKFYTMIKTVFPKIDNYALLKKIFTANHQLFCSELIAMFYQKIGIIPANIDASEVAPVELIWNSYRIVEKIVEKPILNVCDNNEIEKIFEKYGNLLKLFYAETCSNPSGQICDLQKIQDLKNKFSPEASIVIDNTWVSHINFNPFKYNVDYVILSLTKHYACGDTIAGAIIGSKNVMTDVILYEKIAGIHITSDQCLQILENCKNIASRIERARQTEFGESLIPLPLPTSTPISTLHENGLKPGTVEQVYNGDAHYVDMNMENAAREEARRRQHRLAPRADYTKLQAYLREAQAEQEPQPIPEEESTQDTIQAQSQQEPSEETPTKMYTTQSNTIEQIPSADDHPIFFPQSPIVKPKPKPQIPSAPKKYAYSIKRHDFDIKSVTNNLFPNERIVFNVVSDACHKPATSCSTRAYKSLSKQ